MNIRWAGSPNYWRGRRWGQPVAIVNHIAQAPTVQSVVNTFSAPDGVSSHFIIGLDGEIVQCVSMVDSAWGNGIVQRPDLSVPWIADCVAQGIDPNWRTVSKEHVGYSGQPMPEAQYQASLWLDHYISQALQIPLDSEHVNGHCQIDSVDRSECPGPAFPWEKFHRDWQGRRADTLYLPTILIGGKF